MFVMVITSGSQRVNEHPVKVTTDCWTQERFHQQFSKIVITIFLPV